MSSTRIIVLDPGTPCATILHDPWPVYREEDCDFLSFCDEDGTKCLAVDATHYLANDPNGSTRIFPLVAQVKAREYFER